MCNHWLLSLHLGDVQILLIISKTVPLVISNPVQVPAHAVAFLILWIPWTIEKEREEGKSGLLFMGRFRWHNLNRIISSHTQLWIVPTWRVGAWKSQVLLNSIHQIWYYIRKGVDRPETFCSVLCCLLLIALTDIMIGSINDNEACSCNGEIEIPDVVWMLVSPRPKKFYMLKSNLQRLWYHKVGALGSA